ncbi:MAG: D-alanine--D-alanine ligase [Balneolales bacterium]|nr:D-alanine--D-alanine ligase [Balneolales bacterium]
MQTNIVVAFGGISPEHEVSVITAMQAMQALKNKNRNILPLYISKSGRMFSGENLLQLETFKDLQKLEKNASPCDIRLSSFGKAELSLPGTGGLFSKAKSWAIDVIVTAFHGSDGENGAWQGLFESYNIPYTGSGVMASSVGMDKKVSKQIAASLGISVTKDVFLSEQEWVENKDVLLKKILSLGTAVVVKPNRLGSSIGVKKASGAQAISEAVEAGFRYDTHLLAEQAIEPLIEINCSVLGDFEKAEASVCEQPVGSAEHLSFEDKYMGDEGKGMASATRIIPAPIADELREAIQADAVKLFKALDAGGVARLDFLVNAHTNEYFFNEINTIPGSFSFYLWEKSGVSFQELMNRLIEQGIKRYRLKNGRIRSYETNLLSAKAVKGLKGLKGKG